MESKNQGNRDNPQGRLWWLAGLIDGEGNFGASYSVPSKKEPRKHVIRVYFQLGMTDEASVKRASDILTEHNIVHTKSISRRKNSKGKVYEKLMHTVKVTSFESLVGLIDLLANKMVCKDEVSQLLKSYCLARLERKGKSRNSPYTFKNIELVKQIQRKNYRGVIPNRRTLNDFTPRLPIQEDDKV